MTRTRRNLRVLCILVLGAFVSTAATMPAAAQVGSTENVTAEQATTWQQDLDQLAHMLIGHHPEPFRWTSQETFEQSIDALRASIPSMTREAIIVGFARAVAMLGDAHTSLPLHAPEVGFHFLPIELYLFDDGLFVRAAAPEHADLVGSRVTKIGNVAADEALALAGNLISHENEFWLKQRAPQYLQIAEVLFGLGLSAVASEAVLTVEKEGGVREVSIAAGDRSTEMTHGGPSEAMNGWQTMSDGSDAGQPLWLQQPGNAYWSAYVADDDMLYVSYRAVVDKHGGPSNAAFFDHVFALADSLRPRRFVLDVRENGGGNGFYNRRLVRHIIRRPWLDAPDRMFLIIGRGTFSAGIQLVNDVEYFTDATLVGEPTGNAPNQFGDASQYRLANSGINVWISTLWHQSRRPGVSSAFVAPDISAGITSSDYVAHRDPAIQSILDFGSEPPLLDILHRALATGDSLRVASAFEAYRADPKRQYADVEAEMNAAGYALLNAGSVDHAILLFGLNARAYSASANVFDSLGEALERAGRKSEAIAAYQKALSIDPGYGSSADGLRRLGVGDASTRHR